MLSTATINGSLTASSIHTTGSLTASSIHTTGAAQWLGRRGGGGGSRTEWMVCPAGKVMVGLDIKYGAVVDSVGPICK